MKNAFLTILLGLLLAVPATALAQTGDDPSADEGTTDTADEVAAPDDAAPTEDVAPVEEPEPEVSTPAEDPAAATGDPAASASGDASASAGAGAGTGEGGEQPPEGGGEGLRWDLETGRWVKDVEPLPWRNSFFFWSAYVSGYSFAPDAAQTYNPYVLQWFTLAPRWYLDSIRPSVSLRFRVDLFWENTTPDNGQIASFWDPRIGIFDTNVVELPGEIPLGLGITFRLPLSVTSRNCNQILSTQGSISLTKVIPDILSGLQLNFSGVGVYTASSSNVCKGENPYNALNSEDLNRRAPTLATMPNSNDAGSLGMWSASPATDFWGALSLSANLAFTPELSIGVSYGGLWYHSRDLPTATISVDSAPGGAVSLADASRTKLTVATSLGISLNWLANEWAFFSIGWTNAYYQQPQLDPSGNWYNPFWAPQVALSLFGQFQLDAIYTDLTSSDEEEATTAANEEAESAAVARWHHRRAVRADNGTRSGRAVQ